MIPDLSILILLAPKQIKEKPGQIELFLEEGLRMKQLLEKFLDCCSNLTPIGGGGKY
jgi:hypothetical protein